MSRKKQPQLRLRGSELNKRKLQQRLSVFALRKKPKKSVWLKLKLLKLPQLPRLIGSARKNNSVLKQRNSSTRKKNLKRKLQNWQHLKKLKHL